MEFLGSALRIAHETSSAHEASRSLQASLAWCAGTPRGVWLPEQWTDIDARVASESAFGAAARWACGAVVVAYSDGRTERSGKPLPDVDGQALSGHLITFVRDVGRACYRVGPSSAMASYGQALLGPDSSRTGADWADVVWWAAGEIVSAYIATRALQERLSRATTARTQLCDTIRDLLAFHAGEGFEKSPSEIRSALRNLPQWMDVTPSDLSDALGDLLSAESARDILTEGSTRRYGAPEKR